MSRAAQEQGRGRGRGKTQLRETDIKTDAGRLHERTYVHIPEYMSVHLQKRFSGSLIASTIIIIIICDKRREGVFPLARSDIVPLSFARPIPSFRIHRCCIYNKSSRKATIRGGKLQMQFVTHKFKKHKNETLCVCVWVWGGGNEGGQRTRVTCRFSIVRKLIYKTQRCGLAFLRSLCPFTTPPEFTFPPSANLHVTIADIENVSICWPSLKLLSGAAV